MIISSPLRTIRNFTTSVMFSVLLLIKADIKRHVRN
jgi:hypothetical protein